MKISVQKALLGLKVWSVAPIASDLLGRQISRCWLSRSQTGVEVCAGQAGSFHRAEGRGFLFSFLLPVGNAAEDEMGTC